jgi:16S rRNA (cytidine1402-2'-O)-methyltransferase
MEKIEKQSLYIVSTPIGNLEDITFRAIYILKNVDLILCEDTRVSKTLFRYYDIQTAYQSYHEHTQDKDVSLIIEKIKQGLTVALISDAGTPLISDPGYELIKHASKHQVRLIPIGGSSAVLHALVASQLPPYPFYFGGFFPRKQAKQEALLESLIELDATLIFYEAPLRVKKTLSVLFEVLGDRQVTLARELTKKFETFYYINLNNFNSIDIQEKGEYVILIHGFQNEEKPLDQDVFSMYESFISQGIHKNDAMKMIGKKYHQSKNTVYAYIKTKGASDDN